ncbi:MAG TPA: lytic transglycosylase domain-containing protein [Vicinamibacterales bacterium]|nr:lytic transglycosylase domain-containing protein [Vicinamibacterales bacterium]
MKLIAITAAALALVATEARADIVVFKNGRTMSVKSCLLESETATLRMRDGGEVTFPSSIVARVEPDEVPFPEEVVVAPVAAVAALTSVAPVLIPAEVLAARPYADLISTIAATHNLDARLVHAVIQQESNYQARARSKKGAKGLMQLMPDTARQYGVQNSYDPKANLEAGIRHLKDLMSRLELPLALAAYNAGEGTIKRYGGVPPYAETQNYVRSILQRVGVTRPAGTN